MAEILLMDGRPRAKKVLLIIAPSEHTLYTHMNLPPFGPGIVSSYLRQNEVDVAQYDLNTDFGELYAQGGFTKQQLQPFYDKRAVLDFMNGGEQAFFTWFAETLLAGKSIDDYDVVGVSCGGDFSWLEMHSGFVLGTHIQRRYGKPVIFGGNNLDYLIQFKDAFAELWHTALQNFRFLVTGPGEIVFHEILQHITEDDWRANGLRRGLVYASDGQVMRAPDQKHIIIKPDFDGLRLQSYHNYVRSCDGPSAAKNAADEKWNLVQLYKWPSYLSWSANRVYAKRVGKGMTGKLVLPYVFNYNCPYACAFCTESLERLKVVHATVDQVLDDLQALMQQYDTNYFFFFNNYFNLSYRFVHEFCKEVVRRGIKIHWSDCARFNNLDYETLALMKQAGCAKLTFGLETASGKMLNLIDKRVKLTHSEQVLRWCKELGIWADLEIITGMPHEDEGNFHETCRFLEFNADYINFFNVNRYFVAPKSLMGAYPERYGMELIKNPTAYQDLLDANFAWVASDRDMSYKPQNFRVYQFNEIGGRKHDEIVATTSKKIAKLNQIQNREFEEAWHVLNIIDGKGGLTPQRISNETLAFM